MTIVRNQPVSSKVVSARRYVFLCSNLNVTIQEYDTRKIKYVRRDAHIRITLYDIYFYVPIRYELLLNIWMLISLKNVTCNFRYFDRIYRVMYKT